MYPAPRAALVWSFTFLLRPGLDAPLLDALAQRAAELGRQQLLDAQVWATGYGTARAEALSGRLFACHAALQAKPGRLAC